MESVEELKTTMGKLNGDVTDELSGPFLSLGWKSWAGRVRGTSSTVDGPLPLSAKGIWMGS